ncbi:ABC-type antimicrobial peptide transport system, ATPase component [Dehalogenimonas alkenigignens]|uniref:ABC-type antimicrobial peptide transport system, ATPase component n=1 Tax=Dehalogenimonas alkenigignens TaxID=1217799 RepID=A0A0W0GL72_9CHLR|nr:ABC transporter ATP-binding protein [Dehalogenimonas alkenigignens]KTB49287.1 ABC-type antimicrobial peptide transport system, ATPase component [Dehalogenimonas alkenigignens]
MLEVKNVCKIYGEGESQVKALDGVSFTVESGSFLAIMGPSGSGKSTLLNIIGGLDNLSSGEIILNNQRVDNLTENQLVNLRRGKLAYVFQQYHLLPSLTAVENVLLPLIYSGAKADTNKALEALGRVGLAKRAYHKPGQLSGGEQQRVAIARALISDPRIILADEPTGNIDQKTGGEILHLFEELHAEGRSVVMVTHAPEVARRAQKTLHLKDGKVVEIVDNSKLGGE